MFVLCTDKLEFNYFCKIPAKYANVSSYAHVATVGRRDQQQLTRHLKTSWTNEWRNIESPRALLFWSIAHFVTQFSGHHFVQFTFFSTSVNAICMSVRLEFFTASVAMNGTTSATVEQWLTCAVKPRPPPPTIQSIVCRRWKYQHIVLQLTYFALTYDLIDFEGIFCCKRKRRRFALGICFQRNCYLVHASKTGR